MNRKFMGAAAVVFALIFGILAVGAYAGDYGKTKGDRYDLEGKFSKKAEFLLKNQEELKLSDEQAAKIKDLELNTQKEIISKDAQLEIAGLDLQSSLGKDAVNTDEVNKLIDKKYDLKKEKDKSLVNAYAALNNILTEEQKEKIKGLWKKCKKEMMPGSMMKEKMGHPMMKGK
ncbi:MAG: Spy/CpxP family protein refolding chaperone [Candidatus Omnitrophota bacterium]